MTSSHWIVLTITLLFAFTPRWTRPDLYFGVTVQTDFASTPEARRILWSYWLRLASITLVALGLATHFRREKGWAVMLPIAWQFIGANWPIAGAHRATMKHSAAPASLREADLSARRQHFPGGWPLALGPLVLLAAVAVYLTTAWNQLPSRIPVHWGLHGPDRWMDRTPAHVASFLLLLASICGMFLLTSYGILHWSRRISVSGARGSRESSFRRTMLWLLVCVPYQFVAPALLLAFNPQAPAVWIWPVLTLVAVVIGLAVLMRLGQGGGRAAGPAEYQPPIGDHTPDAAWKWGQFYYNPADPALIVEKRFGLGYTLNFGNRWSWMLTAAMLLPVILAITLH